MIDGTGQPTINDCTYSLTAGSLILIQRVERQEIGNMGTGLLKTLNIYVPPDYESNGGVLPSGKPG